MDSLNQSGKRPPDESAVSGQVVKSIDLLTQWPQGYYKQGLRSPDFDTLDHCIVMDDLKWGLMDESLTAPNMTPSEAVLESERYDDVSLLVAHSGCLVTFVLAYAALRQHHQRTPGQHSWLR